LFMLVTKYDVWCHLLKAPTLTDNPWRTTRRGITALDVNLIGEYSQRLRTLLCETCPEVVDAAEGFASQVTYLPVSSLGRRPILEPESGRWTIQPRNLRPLWSTVPLIYGLSKCLSGLIPRLRGGERGSAPTEEDVHLTNPSWAAAKSSEYSRRSNL
jgi:hypothetical protein